VKQDRASCDALQFYTELQQLTSVAACAELFKQTVARLGIHAFACGEIDLAERDRNVMFIDEWPKAWVRYYLKSGLVARDPILNALQVCRSSFSFDDIRRDPRFSNFDRAMVRAASDHGWALGLAVPVARGGARFGLVTLIGRGQEFEQSHRAFLCLISECLLTRIRSLGPGIDYAAPAGMSRREIEAARLVALGFSDEEIGRNSVFPPPPRIITSRGQEVI
jgi:hypothetical protein